MARSARPIREHFDRHARYIVMEYILLPRISLFVTMSFVFVFARCFPGALSSELTVNWCVYRLERDPESRMHPKCVVVCDPSRATHAINTTRPAALLTPFCSVRTRKPFDFALGIRARTCHSYFKGTSTRVPRQSKSSIYRCSLTRYINFRRLLPEKIATRVRIHYRAFSLPMLHSTRFRAQSP